MYYDMMEKSEHLNGNKESIYIRGFRPKLLSDYMSRGKKVLRAPYEI